MAEAQYSIYHVNKYSCHWTVDQAIVAAESPAHALSLLEQYLKFDPDIRPELHGRDINFRLRGAVIDTLVKADKAGVLFPRSREEGVTPVPDS